MHVGSTPLQSGAVAASQLKVAESDSVKSVSQVNVATEPWLVESVAVNCPLTGAVSARQVSTSRL